MQNYTFFRLFIDCPQTKIVTWVHDTNIHHWGVYFKKLTTHHNAHTCVSTPGNVLWVHVIEVGPTKLISTQNVGLKNDNYNENIFWSILKSQICDISYNFGLWTVNKKSDKSVTLHSDFLEMSYEFNIKMKFLAPLLLGDF